MAAKLKEAAENQSELTMHLEKVINTSSSRYQQHCFCIFLIFRIFRVLEVKIAGNSTEYVNKIIEKVKNGIPGGGLDEF